MASLFSRLEYNYTPTGNQVIEFSESTIKTLSFMPKFLDDWQYEAMANNDLEGYTYNPVANSMNIIISAANSIYSNANGCVELSNIANIANTMIYYSGPDPAENLSAARSNTTNSVNRFIEHTNRLAGISPIEANTADLPHYDTAMAVGKSLMYLMYQSDGITNNAPIIGSFTSLFIKDSIIQIANQMYEIANTINNSITITPGTLEPPTPDIKSTNLTVEQIANIEANLISFSSNTFIERRVHDENFFANAKKIMEDYQKMTRYKDTGETETNMLKNYIGTDKLKNNNSKFK